MQEDNGLFYIHFDLTSHELPLDTFIVTALKTKQIIDELNRNFFDNQIQYEFTVVPPQNGSFLSKLKVIVVVGGVVVAFLETDMGAAFVKGLTNHKPEYWTEEIGKALKENLRISSDTTKSNQVICDLEAVVLVDITKAIIMQETESLERVGINPRTFPKIYNAKSEFYSACANTKNLKGIGFEKAPNFPIKRDQFFDFQILQGLVEDEIEEPWLTGTAILRVTSPNWDRGDTNRNWKGRDSRDKERFFTISDEIFWRLVEEKKLKTEIIDVMKVQLAFKGSAARPKNTKVLKVLKFNRSKIGKPLNKNALDTILGSNFPISNERQGDFFELLDSD